MGGMKLIPSYLLQDETVHVLARSLDRFCSSLSM